MTTYPVEFHRRLEQKWASRIDQILTLAANATPPRDPNDNDDDEDEDEDEEDEERDDEPAVVREPEPEEQPAAALGSLPQGPMDYSDGKGRIEVAEHRCR